MLEHRSIEGYLYDPHLTWTLYCTVKRRTDEEEVAAFDFGIALITESKRNWNVFITDVNFLNFSYKVARRTTRDCQQLSADTKMGQHVKSFKIYVEIRGI